MPGSILNDRVIPWLKKPLVRRSFPWNPLGGEFSPLKRSLELGTSPEKWWGGYRLFELPVPKKRKYFN